MTKVDKFNWTKPGDQGRLQMVHIDEINFDDSYQRPVVEWTCTQIAKGFSWDAFGVVTLMRRHNGSLWCIDGKQRIAACRKRGDITKVPAVIYESLGRDHEAKAFLFLNTNRATVKAEFKYWAQRMAGLEPAISIDKFLTENKLEVVSTGGSPSKIAFIGTLMETWKTNPEAAKRAILFQKKITLGRPMSVYVHKGFYFLVTKNIKIENYEKKLIREGGIDRMVGSITATANTMNADKSTRICGMGVAAIINRGSRSGRIDLVSLSD